VLVGANLCVRPKIRYNQKLSILGSILPDFRVTSSNKFLTITESDCIGTVTSNRVVMLFNYLRKQSTREELIAQSEQHVACMLNKDGVNIPTPVPKLLREALKPYLS